MTDPTRPVTGYPAPNQPPNGYSQPPPPPSATAYPYAAPPPQTYPYYNYPNPQTTSYSPPSATLLRRFLAVIIATIILTGIVVFIIWLVLRPRLPEFRLDAFSITSPLNLTADRLSAAWDVSLTSRNPNKKITLFYDDMQAAVFYRGESLADTYLAPFVQGRREESAVKASFVAASTFVDGDDARRMSEERGRGSVGFNVRIIADVRFKAGIWRARRRLLKVYCGDLVVSVAGNGSGSSFVGGPRQCSVGL